MLTHQGLGCRYHLKPSKSVMIMHPENLEAGKVSGKFHWFKVYMNRSYLRVYIRDNKSKIDWMREQKLTREKNIGTISKTGKYPQGSYAWWNGGIQSEWKSIKCVAWDMGDAFIEMEKMIQENFCLVISSERQKPSYSS